VFTTTTTGYVISSVYSLTTVPSSTYNASALQVGHTWIVSWGRLQSKFLRYYSNTSHKAQNKPAIFFLKSIRPTVHFKLRIFHNWDSSLLGRCIMPTG